MGPRLSNARWLKGHRAGALVRGAIIGSVNVVEIVTKSTSAWFFGPRGLYLRDPQPCDPLPCSGALGYFDWKESGAIEQPLKWMLPKPDAQHPVEMQGAARSLRVGDDGEFIWDDGSKVGS
jgi:hypothetical protein